MVCEQRYGSQSKKISANVPRYEKNRVLRLAIEGRKLNATDHVKLLGIEIDSKLMLNKHVEALCYIVNKRATDFSTLNNFISTLQAQAIYNAVILSSFNYCPLI